MKVIKIMAIGFALYAVLVLTLAALYHADPEGMNWQERETFNLKQIGQLDLGAQKDDVIRLLGSPDISEAKATAAADVQILFYRTHHVTSDGITTRDECTPLLFIDNELVAWGESAYDDYQSQ